MCLPVQSSRLQTKFRSANPLRATLSRENVRVRLKFERPGRVPHNRIHFDACGFPSGVRDSVEPFEESVLEFVKRHKGRTAMVYDCTASSERLFPARQGMHYRT